MSDLAKLASEITPGPWELKNKHTAGSVYYTVEAKGSKEGEIVQFWRNPGDTDIANATATAIVPELIAEVLRLREEFDDMGEKFEIQRKMINELTLENVRLREENARQADQIHGFMVTTKPGEKEGDICYRGGCTGTLKNGGMGPVICSECGWSDY